MTEAEWLAATEPLLMLEFLRGKATDRKLRLFACGCARRVWNLLSEKQERNAVEEAERYADGVTSFEEYKRASFAGNPYGMLLDDGAAVA